jgi:hypothetical protein
MPSGIMMRVAFFYYYSLSIIVLSVVMLSIVMLSVIMLSTVMLNVVMLSVVAPQEGHWGRRAKPGWVGGSIYKFQALLL